MANFQTVFEAYGADYEATMKRFLGNEAMYLRLLGMLPKDTSVEDLGLALSAGDLRGAFEAAHTLKGVAGNLGLRPLYEAVEAIVGPLRRQEEDCDYPGLYAEIQSAHKRAIRFLAELKGEDLTV